MATPFLPPEVENQQLTAYRQFNAQMQAYAKDTRTVERSRELVALYNRRPWLSPGIATSYVKWKEQLGPGLAKDLARAAYGSERGGAPDPAATSGPRSFARPGEDLEEFIASKDFQSKINKQVEGYYSEDLKFDQLGTVPQRIIRQRQREKFESGDQANPIGDIAATVGEIPGVKPAVKAVSRVGFTALESPYQEVQAAASSTLAHVAGAFAGAAQGPPSSPGIQAGGSGAADTIDIGVGELEVGSGSPFGTSTGAIALERLIAGKEVDLGTGYFPGGAVQEEHVRRVREIAKFSYDGKEHFATPGRILAATVTEPGTDPFNILSGSIDALALVKADPTLLAGAKLEEIRQARRGFSTAAQLESAGGHTSWVRNFTHGPTVDVFLDERKQGARLIDDLTANLAGKPENVAEYMRRSKWMWPVDVYASIANSVPGDRAAVRSIMGDALGAAIPQQPKLGSFAANIRNRYQQSKFFSELPAVEGDLTQMSGPNGTARQIYNHSLGLGLNDEQISRNLHGIISASGRVERADAVRTFFNMERDALRNLGLPKEEWSRFSAFAISDMNGKARVYFDNLIAEGDRSGGVILGGSPVRYEGPYIPSEYLGDRLWLPKLTGKDGRNRAVAKYGRIFGLNGTTAAELAGINEVAALAPDAYRAARDRISGSNAWLINAQNKVWKPVALLRGAWTLRVIGEEQVRMAMAGYDSLFSHPLRYIMETFQHGKAGSQAEKDLLEYGARRGALRHAQEGAWGFDDRVADAHKRFIMSVTDTLDPTAGDYSKLWADRLIAYHEDEVMRGLAHEINVADTDNGMAAFMERFLHGDLAGARADLATSSTLLAEGIDTRTIAGANTYVDGLFQRLHGYTGGDPDLIATIATGRYRPTGLVGRPVRYGDTAGEIVEHKANATTAKVLFDDKTVEDVPLNQLDIGEIPDEKLPRVLSRTQDDVRVDYNFTDHLDSLDDAVKPTQVSGLREITDPDSVDALDAVVRSMFGFLMDRPTTYMSRGPVFLQAYLNEVERLLPYADRDAQTKLLARAGAILHQSDDHAIRGLVLKGRFKELQKAADTSTIDGLAFDEVDELAKGHGIDTMRELLYDSHKRNRTMAALQLLFPFGEAFKEMVGSWTRIAAQKPITGARKFQVLVTEARSGNPFDHFPGGDSLPGNGFFFKDPNRDGEEMYAAPFMGAVNEKLFGVRADMISPVQGLSMGLQLLPGVGPVVSMPAMYLMNRFLQDPKWDPLRQFIGPYAGKEPVPLTEAAMQQFLPAWSRKWIAASDGNIRGNSQSARALNGLTIDLMTAGSLDGTYDLKTKADVDKAFEDAFSKAKQLYFFTGTFQFGSPSAPSVDLIVDPKNDKATRLVMMRDEFFKLVDKDKENGTHDAAALYINRFGERGMFVVGPKTLGAAFGQQYTEKSYDWVRRNPDIVNKYPLTYPEFGPRSKPGDKFSYDAYLRTLNMGEKQTVDPKEWARGTNNILGSIWYDKFLTQELGLAPGQSIPEDLRLAAADKRNEIGANYFGWRLHDFDNNRIAEAVMELIEASADPALKKSNPKLIKALAEYVDYRQAAIDEARDRGIPSDFTRPGFAESNETWGLRQMLREKAAELGAKNEQFLTLWEDTFEREMKDD